MKICKNYPVTLEQYKALHKQKHGEIAVEARYTKAKYVYACLLKPWLCEPYERKWTDIEFGTLKNPEDAFKVWWDV